MVAMMAIHGQGPKWKKLEETTSVVVESTTLESESTGLESKSESESETESLVTSPSPKVPSPSPSNLENIQGQESTVQNRLCDIYLLISLLRLYNE